MKSWMIVLLGVTLAGCGKIEVRGKDEATLNATEKRAVTQRLRRACASSVTYDRLKDIVFDHAAQARGGGSTLFDRVAAASTVRMDSPVARSRDDKLNLTLCTGRLALQLPPDIAGGATIEADVEYSAQEALDGTGPVYRIKGAEPIVQRLAALALKGDVVRTAASPTPRPVAPAPAPVPPPPPRAQPPVGNPAFNCANARSRVEQMICGSERLAERDRKMSARYRDAWADADAATRADLAETGRRFLRFRDRCPDERCVARAYSDRIDEIKDIARGRY